jgi:Bacterial Ig-like domain (group 3)/Putative Ig domain
MGTAREFRDFRSCTKDLRPALPFGQNSQGMMPLRVIFASAALISLGAFQGSPAYAATGGRSTTPALANQAPFRPGPHLTPLVRPGLKNASAPAGAHLNYYGGRVVSNIQVVQILWGTGSYSSNVSSTSTPSLATMYQQVTNSAYFDWLTEYNTTNGVQANQAIGRGSFAGQYTITPASSATTIDDSTIQTELSNQLAAGHLPPPTHDPAGNNDTYYSIFFPHGDTITQGGSSSCQAGGFGGYHGTIANAGGFGEIYYGVQPDFQPGSGCDTGTGPGTEFQNEMSVATHELVETTTDPEVGLAATYAPPLAWYDPTNGEIGDICIAQEASIVGADGQTYTVQKMFSNLASDCIVSRPVANDFSITANPATVTVAAGASGSSAVTTTVTAGSAGTVNLAVSGAPSGVTATLSPLSVTAGGGSTLAISTTPATAPGKYTLTVTGTEAAASHATAVTLNVTNPPTITSANSATFTIGQPGTFTVTAAGSPTPTLTESGALPAGVTFVDNGTGTATLSGTPSSGTSGIYKLVITAHNSAGDATQNFSLTVNEAATTTKLLSSANPSVYGQVVTFTATVAGAAPNAYTPTGTVSFSDGTVSLGSATLVHGTASLSSSSLAVGGHPITATYSGDGNFLTSSSNTVNQMVNKAATALVAAPASRLNPTFSATLTRVVDGAPIAGRKLTFSVSGIAVCSGVTNASGVASCHTIGIVLGPTSYGVSFAGDASYLATTTSGRFG